MPNSTVAVNVLTTSITLSLKFLTKLKSPTRNVNLAQKTEKSIFFYKFLMTDVDLNSKLRTIGNTMADVIIKTFVLERSLIARRALISRLLLFRPRLSLVALTRFEFRSIDFSFGIFAIFLGHTSKSSFTNFWPESKSEKRRTIATRQNNHFNF